jgi:hypothetical protein
LEKDWNLIAYKLEKLPYNIKLFNPLYGNSMFGTNPISKVTGKIPTNTYFTLYPDGMITFHEKDSSKLPEYFRKPFNLNDIDDVVSYFKKGLEDIRELEEK